MCNCATSSFPTTALWSLAQLGRPVHSTCTPLLLATVFIYCGYTSVVAQLSDSKVRISLHIHNPENRGGPTNEPRSPTAGSGPGEKDLRKQRASYARWQLAASSINTTNHYVITSDTTEKAENICNTVGPRTHFRTEGHP